MWPRDRAFAARAEAGSQWALSELHTRIGAGDLEGARVAAESLAPFSKTIGSQAGLLGTALQVAAALDAAGTAAMLLEPFRVETVTPEHTGGLAAAAGQYGEEWTRGVIGGWSIITRPLRDEDDWSIEWTGCGCDLCDTLGTFLGSRSRWIFEWPLRRPGGGTCTPGSTRLGYRCDTRPGGRDGHTALVLTKTGELFTREKDARHGPRPTSRG